LLTGADRELYTISAEGGNHGPTPFVALGFSRAASGKENVSERNTENLKIFLNG